LQRQVTIKLHGPAKGWRLRPATEIQPTTATPRRGKGERVGHGGKSRVTCVVEALAKQGDGVLAAERPGRSFASKEVNQALPFKLFASVDHFADQVAQREGHKLCQRLLGQLLL